jgi:quercetin dioxygenase-like cupin family protein
MRVVKRKDIDPQPANRPIFMNDVKSHQLADKSTAEQLTLGWVQFAPNARTKWHTHPFEQGLVIVEGKGIVATESAEHVVEPGDVVVVPAGEKHWHGGSETTGMAHISIAGGPGDSVVLEPVDEVKTKV